MTERKEFFNFDQSERLFTDKLARYSDIYRRDEYPGWLIKKLRLEPRVYDDERYVLNTEEQKHELQQNLLFLEQRLEAHLPEFHLIYREEEGKEVPYIFTKEVTQSNISESEQMKTYLRQADDLLAGSGQIFLDTYNLKTRKGKVLDIERKNLVYGITDPSTEQQLYLVDFNPHFYQDPVWQRTNMESYIKDPLALIPEGQVKVVDPVAEYNFPKSTAVLEKIKQLED